MWYIGDFFTGIGCSSGHSKWSFLLTNNFDANKKMEAHTQTRSLDAKERAAKQQKISEAVKQNIEKAQEKQKAYYDRKQVQLLKPIFVSKSSASNLSPNLSVL